MEERDLPHSIKYGTPDFHDNSDAKVRRYMTAHQVDLRPNGELDETQTLNQELLQIISRGINNIVMGLKRRLGNNYTESDTNANNIITRLNTLQDQINTEIGDVDNVNGLRSNETDRITLNENYEIKPIDDNYAGLANNGERIEMNNIGVRDDADFTDLDSKNISVINNQQPIASIFLTDISGNQVMTEGENGEMISNISYVETRLKNCQNLEYLYLKKHNEIMKIFVFTISLFKKYKYAIKVMLYLLRYLVYKDPQQPIPIPIPVNPLSINIPYPVIRSIGKLLKDQVKIQNIIDRMDHTINPGKPAAVPTVGVQPDEATAEQAQRKLHELVPTNGDETRFNVPANPAN